MKKLFARSIQIFALLVALAVPALSEESNRGLYEGDLTGGGKIVFFVLGNHAMSAYIFDTAGHQASFAGGAAGADGNFALLTNNKVPITGKLTPTTITATFSGQNITAARTPIFGASANIAGRFNGSGKADGGVSINIKIVVDSQNNIFVIAEKGTAVLGGFGTVTVQPAPPHTASDSADADPDPNGERGEDPNLPMFTGTFTITGVGGEAISGSLTFGHGIISGTITIDGVTYSINASQESSFNHIANIATRGFVNTGQGQLIGGFIITGGPKLVLVRALGPTLTASGVSPVLANPKLQLFQGQTILRENDDWQSAANASDITATTIAPKDPKESAILIRLEPGAYTTVVTGSDGGTGIALVEVYEINRD